MLKYIAMAMALVAFVTVNAETVVKPYGFGSVSVPMDGGGEYALRWARVGANVNPRPWMRIHTEYDIATSKLSYGYAEVATDVVGVRGTIAAGQMLSPVGYLYPGPAILELTCWPDTLSAYALRNTGIVVSASGEEWIVRVSWYAEHRLSATATYKKASLFWQKGAGGGAIMQPILIHRYFQPSAGVSVETVETVAFVQNRATITPWLKAYVQADYHSAEDGVSTLLGLTATYAPRSFVKLFWDGKEETFKTEITFAF
ncbi:MAG: hypothetical protein A2986_02975 [Candidatus Jacksonbacteria bacterium RIFCSPLOWO2_01_FULL_44_13]|nr:MAG: hypothetical protein A2986_02975 [Candidatus Jacksonbacteria bacterium RIFCSPLOWO2_01_FULL_44_13]